MIDHPTVPLLAFIDSDFTADDVAALSDLVNGALREARDWALDAPAFVDETHDGVRTIGAVLPVRAAFDQSGTLLDEDLDRRHFEDAREFVQTLARFSSERDIDLGLELDGGSVGWIESGRLTEDLSQGLLAEWSKRFAA